MHSAHPCASPFGQLRCEKRLSLPFFGRSCASCARDISASMHVNRISASHPLSSTAKIYFRPNKNPRFVRNAGLVFGGAKRDRTADLNTASVALSQLSYSPKVLLGLRPEAGRIVCSRFGSVKEKIPCLPPLLQANQVVNYCAGLGAGASAASPCSSPSLA
jgi:hypothetical protein